MREETRSLSNAFGMATKQNHDLLGRLNDANSKNEELEHLLQECAQHMALMQRSSAQRISTVDRHNLTMSMISTGRSSKWTT